MALAYWPVIRPSPRKYLNSFFYYLYRLEVSCFCEPRFFCFFQFLLRYIPVYNFVSSFLFYIVFIAPSDVVFCVSSIFSAFEASFPLVLDINICSVPSCIALTASIIGILFSLVLQRLAELFLSESNLWILKNVYFLFFSLFTNHLFAAKL